MSTRRKFICGATAFSLVMPTFLKALAREADASTNTIIVVVELEGGNDGFNTIIPWDATNYGIYSTVRSSIAHTQAQVGQYHTAFNANHTVSAASATQYAMAPFMGNTSLAATNNMRSLYSRGKLAIIGGVGLPQTAANREDHGAAKILWALGTDDTSLNLNGVGWTGATADNLKFANIPLIAMGGAAMAFQAATVNQITVGDSLEDFSVNSGILSAGAATTNLNTNGAYALPTNPAEFVRALSNSTLQVVGTFANYAAAQPAADYVTTYTPVGGSATDCALKDQLKQVARLIMANAPTRCYYTNVGNVFDTHAGQNGGNAHQNALQQVSEGITEFHDYLAAHGASSNVLVMTVSDFGRRSYANASAGTDHGTASFAFLAGDRVNGGFYGAYPSLKSSDLDNDGNTSVPVDFRSQLGVAISWLGADPSLILTGSRYASPSSALPGIVS